MVKHPADWAGLPRIKRVYAEFEKTDGKRILVDRLWPRGISKENARIDLWLKNLAPSNSLRKQFHGKEGVWGAFCAAYAGELEGEETREAIEEIRAHLRGGKVTLLYAARDEAHNNAVALLEWLLAHP